MTEEFIGPKDLLESAQMMITALYEQADAITSLRVQEAESKLNSKRAGENLAFALADASIEISAWLGSPVDPATGKSNKDYTAKLLERELRNHGKYQEAANLFADAEADHVHKQVALRNAMDTFTAIRGAQNLVAAMLYFLTDNRPVILTGGDKNE